jgi:amidohydrolase
MLLGCAHVLNELRDNFAGCVKLIFQPRRGVLVRGAIDMIRDGVMENPHIDVIFAQHVAWSRPSVKHDCDAEIPAPPIAFSSPSKARAVHGARPNNASTATSIAAKVIDAIQTSYPQRGPLEPVLSPSAKSRSENV